MRTAPLSVDGSFDRERARMIEHQLRRRGVRDPRVLQAMAAVPREAFVPSVARRLSYEDRALPLTHAQTISQPYMVAAMTEALRLDPDDVVLEVGTGSGYQAAVLAQVARQVYTIERIGPLATRARAVLAQLGITNVQVVVGDGSLGWPEHAPYDGIVVTAGAPAPPAALKAQLHPEGGRLVIPVGDASLQELVAIERHGDDYVVEALMGCRFVPLIGEEGW